MASYNRVIIMGNLTRDPEFRQLSSGQSVCRLGLASNRQFKNRQTGMMVQEVCFVDIDVWGSQAESCNQYLQKGRGILVEGRLKLDSWVDNEGQRRSKHSIVADRVTFLPTAAAQDSDMDFAFGEKSNAPKPQQAAKPEPVVKEETPTEPVQAAQEPKQDKVVAASEVPSEPKKEEKAAPSTGEVDFKDQEPFEDDLPF